MEKTLYLKYHCSIIYIKFIPIHANFSKVFISERTWRFTFKYYYLFNFSSSISANSYSSSKNDLTFFTLITTPSIESLPAALSSPTQIAIPVLITKNSPSRKIESQILEAISSGKTFENKQTTHSNRKTEQLSPVSYNNLQSFGDFSFNIRIKIW